MVPPLTVNQSQNGSFHPNSEQKRLAHLLTGNSGHSSYSTADRGVLDGAPALHVAVYSPGGNYDLPLSILGVQKVGAGRDDVSRQELSDWLGDRTNIVPDGTPVVSVVGYLATEIFSPVITFPHGDYHTIGVIINGRNIGGQASLDKQVRVKNHDGAGNPDGSWNPEYLPPLQDMELGSRDNLFLVAGPRFDIGERPGMLNERRHCEPCDIVFMLGLYAVGPPYSPASSKLAMSAKPI